MDEDVSFQRRPLSDWRAESFRLSLFPAPSTIVEHEGWWETVVGEPPEKQITQPRRGGFQEIGEFDGGQLQLQLQPQRIDWWWKPSFDGSEERFPELGAFGNRLAFFIERMTHWLPSAPALERLALGAEIHLPVASKEDGYKQLSPYLPAVKIDAEGTSEFLYRINRRRNSNTGIHGLEINRLCTWGVASFHLAQINMNQRALAASIPNMNFACNLVLDINTAQEFAGNLPSDQLTDLLKEFRRLAEEIATEGDIP